MFNIETQEGPDEKWVWIMGQTCVDGVLVNYQFLTQLRQLADFGYTFVAR